jgi:hypothetical protein
MERHKNEQRHHDDELPATIASETSTPQSHIKASVSIYSHNGRRE